MNLYNKKTIVDNIFTDHTVKRSGNRKANRVGGNNKIIKNGKIQQKILEMLSNEGMSELMGGTDDNPIDFKQINNGSTCNVINNGVNCDVINNVLL